MLCDELPRPRSKATLSSVASCELCNWTPLSNRERHVPDQTTYLSAYGGLIRRSSEPYLTVPSLGGLRCGQANQVCTDEWGKFCSALFCIRSVEDNCVHAW